MNNSVFVGLWKRILLTSCLYYPVIFGERLKEIFLHDKIQNASNGLRKFSNPNLYIGLKKLSRSVD